MNRLWPYALVLVALSLLLCAALVNRIPPDVEVETVPHQLNPSPADGNAHALAYVAPLESLRPTTTTTTAPRPRKRSQALTEPQRAEVFDAAYATEVAQVIREGFARFGADVAEEAVRVGWCESRHVPTARNGVHVGVMQLSETFHRERAARLGFTWEQMTEARPNIAVAADLYAEKGWQPWSCKP